MQYIIRQRLPNGMMSKNIIADTERKTIQLVPGITKESFLKNYEDSLRAEFKHYSKLDKRSFPLSGTDFNGSITEDQYVEKNLRRYDSYEFLPTKGES